MIKSKEVNRVWLSSSYLLRRRPANLGSSRPASRRIGDASCIRQALWAADMQFLEAAPFPTL
jgi:hypothetical protein